MPSNHTDEPSLVSITSPVELPAESSTTIEKFMKPSSPSSFNSRTAINSSPFCSGTIFNSSINTLTVLCGSEMVKNNESISPIPAESVIVLFDETLMFVRVGGVLSNLTFVWSVVVFATGPTAPPKSVYSILNVIAPSSSLSSILWKPL